MVENCGDGAWGLLPGGPGLTVGRCPVHGTARPRPSPRHHPPPSPPPPTSPLVVHASVSHRETVSQRVDTQITDGGSLKLGDAHCATTAHLETGVMLKTWRYAIHTRQTREALSGQLL